VAVVLAALASVFATWLVRTARPRKPAVG
jgi:hypothetical protein